MAEAPAFIHLRTHSAYSLSEGALPVKQLAGMAKDMGMPALAITDTGNLFGALEFAEALAEKGVQPIIGCTLRVEFGDQPVDPRGGGPQRRLPSLALLAKDAVGYANLMKLSSRAYLDSPDHTEPHVPFAMLAELSADLRGRSMRRLWRGKARWHAGGWKSCMRLSVIGFMSNCSGMGWSRRHAPSQC